MHAIDANAEGGNKKGKKWSFRSFVLGLFEKGSCITLAGLELTEIHLLLASCLCFCFCILVPYLTTLGFDDTCVVGLFPFPCLQAHCDILLKGLPESPHPGSLVFLLFLFTIIFKIPCICVNMWKGLCMIHRVSGGQRATSEGLVFPSVESMH